MGDLKNPRWIIAKGGLFLLVGVLSFGLLIFVTQDIRIAALATISVWAFCRFYYFAFYVIQHYVDGNYRFAGLLDFARYLFNRSPSKSDEQAEVNE